MDMVEYTTHGNLSLLKRTLQSSADALSVDRSNRLF
jgi:hypothetical protein